MTASDQPATWTTHDEPGIRVLTVRGELDLRTAAAFGDEGVALVAQMPDATMAVVDLSGVSFIDSTGLRALLRIHMHAGDTLVLRNPSDVVVRILRLTVPDVFTIR